MLRRRRERPLKLQLMHSASCEAGILTGQTTHVGIVSLAKVFHAAVPEACVRGHAD